MQLEDHTGDILRKAQVFLKTDSQVLISASGLSAPQWDELVKTGKIPLPQEESVHWDPLGKLLGVESGLTATEWSDLIERESTPTTEVDWEAIGRVFGIEGHRLQSIAEGWTPPEIPLWEGVKWIQSTGKTLFMGEPLLNTVNSYLVWDVASKEAVLFDPGWDTSAALAFLSQEHLRLTHIFITHAHPDHVKALPGLRQQFPQATVFDCQSCQNRPDGTPLTLGTVQVLPRQTPGHSPDHVIYRVSGFRESPHTLAIVGDCLFSGSVGYPFYNPERLIESLRTQILNLPPETILCPGHGPLTTVQIELDHNPLFSHPLFRKE